MSIMLYLMGKGRGLRMPKTNGQPDSMGIRWEGDVLNARRSVEEALTTPHVQPPDPPVEPRPLYWPKRFRG